MLPVFLLQNVPDQIVLMKALHNNKDASGLLVIQPTVQGMVKPFVHGFALGLRERLVRLERIINDDEVCAAAGQHTSDGVASRKPFWVVRNSCTDCF